MTLLNNIFYLDKIANSNKESTIVRFAIKHSYILSELEAGIKEITSKEPLTSILILSKEYTLQLQGIKNITENRFDEVKNYIVVPMKKTFLGSANTAKQIKFVRDLTESQLKMYDKIKAFQIKGEFIEISEEEAKERFKI